MFDVLGIFTLVLSTLLLLRARSRDVNLQNVLIRNAMNSSFEILEGNKTDLATSQLIWGGHSPETKKFRSFTDHRIILHPSNSDRVKDIKICDRKESNTYVDTAMTLPALR
jgi:hypothetical protein